MANTVTVEPSTTVEIYYKDTPIIPESEPTIKVTNNGPASVTVKNYWGAPFMIGGWHELDTVQISAGENKGISGGDRSYYHYKVEVTNYTSDASATLEVDWD
ncbi:hypothetical protein AG28_25080 [Salmonella enterica subsp. enterica]|nr:hypothetical protein [Salmonella enterica subsp. enterica]